MEYNGIYDVLLGLKMCRVFPIH